MHWRSSITLLVIAHVCCGGAAAGNLSNLEKIERSAYMPADRALEQYHAIRSAIESGSCTDVAEWVSFPFSFRPPKRRGYTVIAQSLFCSYFPKIFDSRRRQAFLDQKLEDAAVAEGGFYFHKSGVWVIAECPRNSERQCPPGLQLRIDSVDL
jgi:hypothetical protein